MESCFSCKNETNTDPTGICCECMSVTWQGLTQPPKWEPKDRYVELEARIKALEEKVDQLSKSVGRATRVTSMFEPFGGKQ